MTAQIVVQGSKEKVLDRGEGQIFSFAVHVKPLLSLYHENGLCGPNMAFELLGILNFLQVYLGVQIFIIRHLSSMHKAE